MKNDSNSEDNITDSSHLVYNLDPSEIKMVSNVVSGYSLTHSISYSLFIKTACCGENMITKQLENQQFIQKPREPTDSLCTIVMNQTFAVSKSFPMSS